eukprot:15336440-Ditylum_brightwellii.AAC.1
MKQAIIDAINTDVGVLTEAFPYLCKIVGKPATSPIEITSAAAQNRFKFIFKVFVRAIATPSHPIVLFLDDLQWVDELSLQLICALVADTEINNFLFIGSYRDNEIGNTHPLTTQLHDLKRKQVVTIDIHVECMSKDDVNTLISDTINEQEQLIRPFSDVVYKKTGGNALFVTQFLQLLWDEGLLFYSLEYNTWQWKIDDIDEKKLFDHVGALMAEKICQLPIG